AGYDLGAFTNDAAAEPEHEYPDDDEGNEVVHASADAQHDSEDNPIERCQQQRVQHEPERTEECVRGFIKYLVLGLSPNKVSALPEFSKVFAEIGLFAYGFEALRCAGKILDTGIFCEMGTLDVAQELLVFFRHYSPATVRARRNTTRHTAH